MRHKKYIFLLLLTFVIEAIICANLLGRIEETKQDPVVINSCLKSVETNYGDPSSYDTSVDYVILDINSNVVFKTRDGLSESINDAVKAGETILDVVSGDEVIGKMIIHDDNMAGIKAIRDGLAAAVIVISLIQVTVLTVFYMRLKTRILDPFDNMTDFAGRIADGDLDVPLIMDRKHVFGNFTEAFDMMRSAIKTARVNEKKANNDKKEMIAKLSHDLKTPIASVKSTSEIGYELASEPRIKEYFNLINSKTDQITALVDNLFNSSVNDVTELSVAPSQFESSILAELIRNSDYLKKAGDITVPVCNIYIDRLRFQQSLDNIFMNSYKYANTSIDVSFVLDDEYLKMKIKDHGKGVSDEDLPLLKNKYARGANSSDKDGAGLGLYLTDYFLEHMNGRLILDNEEDGFAATLWIRTI